MSRGQGETILVVSHHPEEREECAGWMRRAGHGVRVAATAGEALESLGHEAVALVDRKSTRMNTRHPN